MNHDGVISSMDETVDLVLNVETPLGPIRGRINIEKGPMGLADLVPLALQLTDLLEGRAVQQAAKEGRAVSCRAGCGACCRQMVPLSPPEAFYLMDMIDSFPAENKKTVLDRFEPIVTELERHNLIEPLLFNEYSDDVAMAAAKVYFSLQQPCPFLVDESCSIHAYRPVACREFNVTSPAAWCADPFQNEVEKIHMPLPLSAPLARLTGRLAGSEVRLIPLTLAPRWVAANGELRERHWPGLNLFVDFMNEVGKKAERESES